MIKPLVLCAGLVVVCPPAPAEDIDFSADLTAEQLLDYWLDQPDAAAALPPSTWKLDLKTRVGAGYKENVLYSAVHELDSAFSFAEIDAFLYRDSPSPNHLYLYAFADQRHYVELDRGDNEQMMIAEASWTRELGDTSALNLRGTYSFFDQFFDASISELETDAVRLFQHDAGISGYLEKELLPHFTLRLGAGGKQVDLRDLDDDYAQFRALAQAEYSRWPRWKAGVSAEHEDDDYDDRLRRRATGEQVPGETVAISTDSLTLFAKRYWGQQRDWQTHVRLTGRLRNDDGGGYYDYRSWRGSLLLRGPVIGCRWEVGLYYGDTDYDVRPARFGDEASPLLFRSLWRARFRLERDLGRHISLFAEASHEDNDSNEQLDVYTQTWVVLGAGYRL